jgi:hypothetical protein
MIVKEIHRAKSRFRKNAFPARVTGKIVTGFKAKKLSENIWE